MTAPSARIQLTPELYERFTDYHRRELAWGIFHVWLDDGNYKMPTPECPVTRWSEETGHVPDWSEVTDEERELWAIFRQLSPSQMARLAKRCSPPDARTFWGPRATKAAVTGVDVQDGVVTLDVRLKP